MEAQRHSQSAYDDHIERIRKTEYPSLLDTTYLDHAGTTLYAQSLIDLYLQDLKSNLYGNPHSDSPASDLATRKVNNARQAVLEYFNADSAHFDVVFTANATASIKLVADCFRDQDFWYGFHKDAHSSVVGVREVARAGSRCFSSNKDVEDWINNPDVSRKSPGLSLFAYPAQSNMTGHRLPYSWSRQLRDSTRGRSGEQHAYVLLDAASYLTTGRLNLHDHLAAPDFIALSFYKIFGFPDLGALIVRKSAYEALTRRRYFGGGTVDVVTVLGSAFHAKKVETIHDFLEDGTLPFHNIVALTYAIKTHAMLFGTARDISNHTSYISSWLYRRLSSFQHSNGTPVIEFYKETSTTYGDPQTQGPIFAFSVLRSDGTYLGKSHIERLAIDCGFQLRTGGVCNPGGIASMLELSHWELRRNFTEGARCGGDIDVIGGKPTGIVRISLGPMSILSDVKRFADFISEFFVETSSSNLAACQTHTTRRTSGTVTPLECCSAISFTSSDDFSRHQTWDRQWCIVRPTQQNWEPLSSGRLLESLSCSLEPEQGSLLIHHSNKPDLRVDLWNRPKQDINMVKTHSTRPFDIYADPQTAEWLSDALGFPCALARYRGKDFKLLPQARTCVVPLCNAQPATRDEAMQHYEVHARAFLVAHPLKDKKFQAPAPDFSTPSGHQSNWSEKSSGTLFSSKALSSSRHRKDAGGSDSEASSQEIRSTRRRLGRFVAPIRRMFGSCWPARNHEQQI